METAKHDLFSESSCDEFINPIWIVDSTGNTIFINKAWFKYTNTAMEDQINRGWLNTLHPEDQASTAGKLATCFSSQQPFRLYFRVRKFDGTYHPFTTYGEPYYSKEGAFQGYIGTCQELTQLDELRENLSQERNRFAAILKNTPDLLLQIDIDGKLLFLNRAFPGYILDEMVGRSVVDCLDPQSGTLTAQLIEQVHHLPVPFDFCYIDWIQKRYFLVKYVPFDNCKSILISSTEMSESVSNFQAVAKTQTQLEEQKARMAHKARLASLGELSTSLAHEITNPLTIFGGHVEQLKKKIQNRNCCVEDYMANICELEKSLDRLTKVSKSLSHFSRDVSNDPFVFTSLKDIMIETRELVDHKVKIHEITFSVGSIPEVQIECRDVQMAQVLVNLITNSVQAISGLKERWIRVDISDLGSFIRFSVTDSGTGIEPEKRKLIFSPFFTSKPSGSGTGLGLAISQKIVAAHHGVLTFQEDSPNTKFNFEIPKKQPKIFSEDGNFFNSKNNQSDSPIWR